MTTIEQLQQRLATEIKKTPNGVGYKLPARRVTCVDGVTLSVQASEMHYSTPRENHGPYSKVEVGFPGRITTMPTSWREYGECADDTDSVCDIYAYIPIELVAQFIDEHGGIKD